MENEKKSKLEKITCWALMKDGSRYIHGYYLKSELVEMDDEEFIDFAQKQLFNAIIDAKVFRFEDDMYAKDQFIKAYFTYEYEED